MGEEGHIAFIKNLCKDLWPLILSFKLLSCNFLRLIALEAQLAGRSLLRIVILAVLISFLVITIWLFLMAVLVLWLHIVGLSWLISLLLVVALNSFLVLLAVCFMLKSLRNTTFAATRRQFEISRS